MAEYIDPETERQGLTKYELEAKMKAQGLEISYKTIERILEPEPDKSVMVDSVEALAKFFGKPAWAMLKRELRGSAPRPPEPPQATERRRKSRG